MELVNRLLMALRCCTFSLGALAAIQYISQSASSGSKAGDLGELKGGIDIWSCNTGCLGQAALRQPVVLGRHHGTRACKMRWVWHRSGHVTARTPTKLWLGLQVWRPLLQLRLRNQMWCQ